MFVLISCFFMGISLHAEKLKLGVWTSYFTFDLKAVNDSADSTIASRKENELEFWPTIVENKDINSSSIINGVDVSYLIKENIYAGIRVGYGAFKTKYEVNSV